MAEVIFKHISDKNEVVIFEGSMTACKKEVARLKKEAQANNLRVWGWCNNGFSVPKTYWVEIR